MEIKFYKIIIQQTYNDYISMILSQCVMKIYINKIIKKLN
jgi:hypothetical protein